MIYLDFFDFFWGLGDGDRDEPDDELARSKDENGRDNGRVGDGD